MTIAEHRYRTLLEVFSTVAHQPTVKAVLQSLRGVLSSSSRLHGAHLYVLSSDGETLQMLEFDRESDAPEVKTGTKILRIGAVAQVLEKQKPVLVPDVSLEMSKHPELAPFAALARPFAPRSCFSRNPGQRSSRASRSHTGRRSSISRIERAHR